MKIMLKKRKSGGNAVLQTTYKNRRNKKKTTTKNYSRNKLPMKLRIRRLLNIKKRALTLDDRAEIFKSEHRRAQDLQTPVEDEIIKTNAKIDELEIELKEYRKILCRKQGLIRTTNIKAETRKLRHGRMLDRFERLKGSCSDDNVPSTSASAELEEKRAKMRQLDEIVMPRVSLRGGSKRGDVATRYSQEFEEQNHLLDATKEKTQKIIERLRLIMDMYDTRSSETSRYETFADAVMALGQRLPVQSKYGKMLVSVSCTAKTVGTLQVRFKKSVEEQVVMPLKIWIEDSCVEIMKEREILNKRRVEFDSAHGRSMKQSARDSVRDKAEKAGRAHEQQWALLKKMLDRLPHFHEHHRQCIRTFLVLERDYHEAAVKAINVKFWASENPDEVAVVLEGGRRLEIENELLNIQAQLSLLEQQYDALGKQIRSCQQKVKAIERREELEQSSVSSRKRRCLNQVNELKELIEAERVYLGLDLLEEEEGNNSHIENDADQVSQPL